MQLVVCVAWSLWGMRGQWALPICARSGANPDLRNRTYPFYHFFFFLKGRHSTAAQLVAGGVCRACAGNGPCLSVCLRNLKLAAAVCVCLTTFYHRCLAPSTPRCIPPTVPRLPPLPVSAHVGHPGVVGCSAGCGMYLLPHIMLY